MTGIAAPATPRSIAAAIVDKLVAFCRVIPYALVALGLRAVMARLFFLSGQARIEGPVFPLGAIIPELDFDVILPAQLRDSTFRTFEAQLADLPLTPVVAAYLFTYAEFVLPICLVLGFATRLAALGLLGMTAAIQLYVAPSMWWTAHVYWVAILLVLVTAGPGAISLDALIRLLYRRDRTPEPA